MITLEVVGFCPHVKEDDVEPKEVDLRESGWLFGRLRRNLLVLVRIEFGAIAAIHTNNFNATVTYGEFRPGLPLDRIAEETVQGQVEIADFVSFDEEVAARFLKGKLPEGTSRLHSNWKAWQLVKLLQAGNIAGSFAPTDDSGTRPIL